MSLVQQQQKSMTPSSMAAQNGSNAASTSVHVKTERNITSQIPSNIPSTADLVSLTNSENQRLDLGSMIEELTALLGKDNWTKYAQMISHFILGKLSRKELINEINDLFDVEQSNKKGLVNESGLAPTPGSTSSFSGTVAVPHNRQIRPRLIRLHNQLLLGIFTNSLRDSPLDNSDRSWGFQNGSNSSIKNPKRVNKHNSQIETYKKIVMSLPVQDRNRMKLITKEAGKRGFIYCTVLQGRLNNVPKIPIVTNPETLKRVKANNLKTPLEWSQDIMNGFSAPLATDSYSLPDTDSLYLRMIGIAREHGLVGNVDTRCVELLSMALDHYLKNIVEFGIDSIRYRKKRYSDYYDLDDDGMFQPVSQVSAAAETIEDPNSIFNNLETNEPDNSKETSKTLNDGTVGEVENLPVMSLTNEDFYKTINIFPNLIEPTTNAYYNLTATGLQNDDELVVMKSTIDDLSDFLEEKPLFTPLDDRNIGSRGELNWLIKDILTDE